MLHGIIVIVCPISHYNLKHTLYWWVWLVKNKKLVYLDIKTRDEIKLIHKLGYYNGKLKLLIELRDQLFTEHKIIVYYQNLGTRDFKKRLVFSSGASRDLFILKYWNF